MVSKGKGRVRPQDELRAELACVSPVTITKKYDY